jgi:hypothetical protein
MPRRRRLTDEAAGHGVLQLVLLGKEGHDAGEDGQALDVALRVLGHDARPHLDLLAHAQHALRRWGHSGWCVGWVGERWGPVLRQRMGSAGLRQRMPRR